MALFMEVFEGDGLPADLVRIAHEAEREAWEAQGVRCLRYLPGRDSGCVFCLVEAPDGGTLLSVHRETRLPAPEITELFGGTFSVGHRRSDRGLRDLFGARLGGKKGGPSEWQESRASGSTEFAAAAGEVPEVLRLDTDLLPSEEALRATREAVRQDDPHSRLRSPGKADLRRAVGDQEEERSEVAFDPEAGVVITCGEGDAMMDALFVLADPGDEVILTDPTYVGMINRVRIVGAVPRLVPQHREQGEWRLGTDALAAAVTDRTRAIFVANPGLPTGNHLNEEEWEAIASICREPDVWLIYQAWMERILFDQRPRRYPASLPDMADRVIHRGCVSMEQSASGLRWTSSPEGAGSPRVSRCRRRR